MAEMKRDLAGDWRTVSVKWSMDQVSPSMENSSANSSVERRLAWKRKDPMPRTRREMDMASRLGERIPRLPGPYMYRRAKYTGGSVSI